MDILKRSLAPVADVAWEMIEAEAQRVLRGNLSARKLVDFDGPHGWTMAAVNTGVVKVGAAKLVEGVDWGSREVLPLIEARAAFALKIWDLDNISRGGRAPDLTPVAAAAGKLALFEEKAVYQGFKNAGIVGLTAGPQKAIALPKEPSQMVAAVEAAIVALQSAGVGGPYSLVLGRQPYQMLMSGDDRGYPLVRRVGGLLDGKIHWSPALDGGVLLSGRGGDFRFVCGQDVSIGYQKHDAKEVVLFLTESFTFEVLEPTAAIALV